MKRSLAYVWYPLFGSAAVAAYGWMLTNGMAIAVAAYAPVIAVGLTIVVLEWRFPEHRAWRPRWADIRADAAFMALVQVALPRFLAAAGVIALAAWMHAHAPSGWWPH